MAKEAKVTDPYKIEKNVPIPEGTGSRGGNDDFLGKLKPGDSFVVPTYAKANGLCSRMRKLGGGLLTRQVNQQGPRDKTKPHRVWCKKAVDGRKLKGYRQPAQSIEDLLKYPDKKDVWYRLMKNHSLSENTSAPLVKKAVNATFVEIHQLLFKNNNRNTKKK